jgi:hypothetical protein
MTRNLRIENGCKHPDTIAGSFSVINWVPSYGKWYADQCWAQVNAELSQMFWR